eukprot:Opistho-1_new@48236
MMNCKRLLVTVICICWAAISFSQNNAIEFYTDKSPRLRGMMVPTFLDEAGVRELGRWGANHIRWQLTWEGFPYSAADKANKEEYRNWLNGVLAHVDKMLPVCEELGIKVLIDLHTLPGGRMEDYNHRMFTDKAWQDEFVSIWKEIATKYKDNPTVWGYDIANEPQDGRVENGALNWPTMASVVAHEIRAIDANHPIIVEARGGDLGTLERFQIIDVPGVVYSFHMYVPHSFTHQNISGKNKVFRYPGYVGLKRWNKEALRKVLYGIKDWQVKNNAQIYVGEFSAIRWAPGDDAYNYLKDCIDIFEENNWSWAYHAFREYHGWSVEHGNVKEDETTAKEATSRQQLFMDAFKKNTGL